MKSLVYVPVFGAMLIFSFFQSVYAQCPATGTVSGGGILCTSTVDIILSGRTADVTYQLKFNGNVVGTAFPDNINNPPADVHWPVGSPGTYEVWSECSTTTAIGTAIVYAAPATGSALQLSFDGSLTSICPNSPPSVTASGGNGSYTWLFTPASPETPNPNYIGATISPAFAGMYQAVSHNACGVEITSSEFHVTVGPFVLQPALPAGPVSVCKGTTSSQYTTSSPAALNATSISWSVTGTGNTISASGMVTWSSTFLGLAYITATAQGCGGPLNSNQLTVNVSTIPAGQLMGGGQTCPNVNIILSLTVPNNSETDITYTLLRDGAPVSSTNMAEEDDPVQNWDFSQSQAGTYRVVANRNACTNVSVGDEVVITTTPAASIIDVSISGTPEAICLSANTVTFTPLNGTQVLWWSKEDSESTWMPAILPPDITGQFYATGKNECDQDIQSSIIHTHTYYVSSSEVSPSGSVKIRSDATQELTATFGEDYTYQWFKDGTPILDATNQQLTASDPGVYSVEIADAYYCPKLSTNSLSITVNQLPIVNSGQDIFLYLPTNSTSLTGTASDPDGTIAEYKWTEVESGYASLTNHTTPVANASQLRSGVTKFRLTVKDDTGEQASDEVLVTIDFPPNNYNWIKESVVLQEGLTTMEAVRSAGITTGEKSLLWNYFDGVGRPMQQTAVKSSSGSEHDVITPIRYDKLGREEIKHLAYAKGSDGSFRVNAVNPTNVSGDLFTFYSNDATVANDQKPFAKTIYENSPLNRVLQQGAPGVAWQPETGKAVSKQYLMNENTGHLTKYSVFEFKCDSTDTISLMEGTNAYYQKNTLTATETTDEDGNYVIEFIDKQGRTVCKKIEAPLGGASAYTYLDANQNTITVPLAEASTYYIYDIYGNLVVVLPPEGLKALLTKMNFQP